MPLSVGDKLGPYEILAPLGAGGMGEVYRATDTKLEPRRGDEGSAGGFRAATAERMARFQREAQVLAALNHPNIAHHLRQSKQRALVMELVEGADARRPARPLPLERLSRSRGRSPRRSKPRTRKASSIAT